MRKWMRDKLKRRKKSQEEAATGPAPLQPAYFETEPEAKAKVSESRPAEIPEPQTRRAAESNAEPGNDEVETGGEVDGSTPSVKGPGSERRPRRRRRGGRGRKRPGQSARTETGPTAGAGEAPAAAQERPPAVSDDASATSPRPSKGVVVLAVGLPGSGKSSWFKRHNITPLSSDVLRTILFDDPAEQRFQDLIFSNLRSMLKARLIARRPTNYVDATNLTPHERHNWIKLAKDFGYEVHAVFFDVPLEICIERHHRRDRLVPEDVMRKMSAKLKAPTFEEGFSKITVVRVKQKEG